MALKANHAQLLVGFPTISISTPPNLWNSESTPIRNYSFATGGCAAAAAGRRTNVIDAVTPCKLHQSSIAECLPALVNMPNIQSLKTSVVTSQYRWYFQEVQLQQNNCSYIQPAVTELRTIFQQAINFSFNCTLFVSQALISV